MHYLSHLYPRVRTSQQQCKEWEYLDPCPKAVVALVASVVCLLRQVALHQEILVLGPELILRGLYVG